MINPLSTLRTSCESTRASSAQSHTLPRPFARSRRSNLLLTLALGICMGTQSSCGDQAQSAAEAQVQAKSENTAKAIERLIELSTGLDPTLTSDHHDRHLHARRAFMEEIRQGSKEIGLAALDRFLEVEEQVEVAPILVRVNLLDVAAYTATEETQPLLETLLLEYGHRIDIRTEATLLMGKVSPARAVELIAPILKRTKNTSTMPADEFLLAAYINGCKGSNQDPTGILADVATNIYKEDSARHLAVKELGNQDSKLARLALRQILVESTGNAYLRRKAAQAIRKSFAREEACEIFQLIATREADNNFLMFLGDMIEENCE